MTVSNVEGDGVSGANGASYQASQELSSVAEISEEDKRLIREALEGDPSKQPAAPDGKRMGGVGAGKADGEMVAAFTCEVCNTRSVKRFSKHSYTKGIVLVQCPGCANRHLLADHMGWFEDEGKTIEQILAEKGEKVIRVNHVHIENLKAQAKK